VQGNSTFASPFGPGDFSAIETAAHLDFETQDPSTLGTLHSHAHYTAEGNTLFQLLGDVLGKQVGIGVNPFNLNHVDPHLAGRIFEGGLNASAQFFDTAALASNKDTWSCGLEFNLKLVGLAGDQHVADASSGIFFVDELANPIILLKEGGIGATWGVPAGAVFLGDPQAQAGWMDFVSHRSVSSGVRRKETPQQC
jgi:hypothetical protein